MDFAASRRMLTQNKVIARLDIGSTNFGRGAVSKPGTQSVVADADALSRVP